MNIEQAVQIAVKRKASDLHLEPGQPLTIRVQGELHRVGESLGGRQLAKWGQELLGERYWQDFLQQRSFDFSKAICGVRCRVNVLQSSRGIGMAIRLLSSFDITIDKLNLHPSLSDLAEHRHGLILVSGPTGSGKSTTIAALIEEINRNQAKHIITIEQPIEYTMQSKRSLLRQREVGRDTPSFQQALLDSLREDPDVIVVGEMRHPETMRLTLNAAETGHLVITTLHSATCAEALQRIVSAFSPEIQGNVCGQLADCLIGVVCQKLGYRSDIELRVPECEVLMASSGVRAAVRGGHFSKIQTLLEVGRESGMWTFPRYRRWLEQKTDWSFPSQMTSYLEEPAEELSSLPPLTKLTNVKSTPSSKPKKQAQNTPTTTEQEGVFVLEPLDDDLEDIISALQKKG